MFEIEDFDRFSICFLESGNLVIIFGMLLFAEYFLREKGTNFAAFGFNVVFLFSVLLFSLVLLIEDFCLDKFIFMKLGRRNLVKIEKLEKEER